ncbi:MAG: hypothetical protein DRP29_06780 [Thermodesulfobacteriota bacterium]|nr:MAG: hypothetical protein DRP29_06780 [Thermodesulfobacteriota bacterium]
MTEGYKIAYVAEAMVYHSHSLKIWKDFKRHFELGIFFREENWILKTFGKKPKDEGIRIIKEFIKFTKKKGEFHLFQNFSFFIFYGDLLGFWDIIINVFLKNYKLFNKQIKIGL